MTINESLELKSSSVRIQMLWGVAKFTAMYQPLHMDLSQLEFTRVVLHSIAGHAGAEDTGRRNMGALRRDVRSSGQNQLTRVCQWRVWKSTEVNVINLEVLGIKLCLIFAFVPSGNKPCSYFAKFGTSKAFISVPGKRAAFWSKVLPVRGLWEFITRKNRGTAYSYSCL